jgi:hypothetical protein
MIRFVIAVWGAVLLAGSASAEDPRCEQVKQAVATYGYAAARKHALENYGKEAFGDKCLGASTAGHGRAGRRVAASREIGSGVTSLRANE